MTRRVRDLVRDDRMPILRYSSARAYPSSPLLSIEAQQAYTRRGGSQTAPFIANSDLAG